MATRPRIDSIEAHSQAEIEKMEVTAVVCVRVPPSLVLAFPDNLIGKCGTCGAAVQFRPAAPPGPRMCYECFIIKSNEDDGEEIDIHVSDQAVEEVVEYLKKKGEN